MEDSDIIKAFVQNEDSKLTSALLTKMSELSNNLSEKLDQLSEASQFLTTNLNTSREYIDVGQ